MDYKRIEQLVAVHGTPALFFSRNRIRDNFRALQSALPGVELFYAVKANCHEGILATLQEEGALFDVCTNGEIDIVKTCRIGPELCLHTHPIKRDSDIRYALDFGIRLFVADNEFELDKFLPYKDKIKLLIRMSIQNPQCLVNLSQKFGAPPADTFALVKKAADAGLRVAGICFHAGSQNENPFKYIEALEYCRDIYKKAALAGIHLEIVDIGGGFPIDYLARVTPIAQFCQPINEYLARYFSNYRIIAEPGRFICGPAMTLAVRVVGKALREGVWWYYLDEGVYGSFSGKMYDHAEYPMQLARGGERRQSICAGPTCDSIDVVYENIALPPLEIGDLLAFNAMGAYTTASASNFNGFPKAKIVTID
ncbi:MAG: type III PLP-dependent enzyme [Chitinivibrionales bacterium]|nr:type III PLP-dependent enzyme [Chitinivibrionales bacterium]